MVWEQFVRQIKYLVLVQRGNIEVFYGYLGVYQNFYFQVEGSKEELNGIIKKELKNVLNRVEGIDVEKQVDRDGKIFKIQVQIFKEQKEVYSVD